MGKHGVAAGFSDSLGTVCAPARTTAPEPTDATLIDAMLRMAMPTHEDLAPLTSALLARFGSFAGVLSAPSHEIRTLRGLGEHSVAAIRLIQEAALRLARARLDRMDILASQDAVLGYLAARLARERVEQFRILFLGPERHLIADEAQARGTVNHTPVYPREVARRALELGASAIVLVHNHPSGDPTPSEADIAMTRQIVAACAVIDVTIADHLIVGNGRATSFRESGLLG